MKTKKPFKLDPVKKRKWVKALESGEYKQGKEYLHNKLENSYCCLGVAWTIKIAKKSNSGEITTRAFLPQDIEGMLIHMNDVMNWNFKKIAKWIKKNL